MQVFAYTGMALTVLYLCLLVVLRSRIQLSIGIIKESARAVASMPILIFMPVVQVIGIVAFLVPWTIYVVFLASSGELQVVQTTVNGYTFSYRQFSYDTNTKYTFLYMLFCWFWTSQFVVAFGQMTIALAIVAWYFNRNKASVGNVTFLWAVKACARYHMGTVAYGALVIAIIQTIRSIIAYFQRQAKNSKNKIMEYVLCCLQCCMWCLEKVMKFINKNAYIQTAIYSYSFCKASRNAFFLLLRNILRVAAVNMVSSFVLFIGKLLIPALTTFILYLVLAYGSLQMNSILNPLVITFILAYFVSSMFNEIFGMAIETILCCYIADEEMFIPEKRFAEGPLKAAIHATPAKQVQV
jgi:choline transporter-like protein 2/4/5